MADEADLANDFIDNEVSRALGRLRPKTTATLGPKHCMECDERIPEARRKLGFTLCVPCASESERRRALYAGH